MSCQNPCGSLPENSAQSESLPSQIANFTQQFFGEVVKTEVDGVVSWSLPCGLDVGLPENPRTDGEGLACYFLRLFNEGIVGLQGETGETGAAGTNGNNAYTVTLASFTQPTLASPSVQVLSQYNPALRENMYIFIDGSGWYIIDGLDGSGTLFLRLVYELPTPASGTITAGKIVVPCGYPGASVTGATGPTGPAGPQGATGETPTADNGSYHNAGGTDYTVTASSAVVNFTTSEAEVTLPVAGKYLVTAQVGIYGLTDCAVENYCILKLYNATTAGDVTGGSMLIDNLVVDRHGNATISVIVTTSQANETISLYAQGSVATRFKVDATYTTLCYVRIE